MSLLSKLWKQRLKQGLCTPNEMREQLGMPPIRDPREERLEPKYKTTEYLRKKYASKEVMYEQSNH